MSMWIARDKNEDLWLYGNKPYTFGMDIFHTQTDDELCGKLNKDLFPEVTFENSPVEVELKIKL